MTKTGSMGATIGGREYTFYMGLAFLREVDKIYQNEKDVFGASVPRLYAEVVSGSPLALLKFIQAATITEQIRPTEEEIENYLMEQDLEALTKYFLSQLETQPLTRHQIQLYARIGEALQQEE